VRAIAGDAAKQLLAACAGRFVQDRELRVGDLCVLWPPSRARKSKDAWRPASCTWTLLRALAPPAVTWRSR
jgi:hypothetical protein